MKRILHYLNIASRQNPTALALGLICAGGLLLRLIRLDFQPLWFDEGYSFYFAAKGTLDLLAATAVDIHPPLYYILLKIWLAVFGFHSTSARLFSALTGGACIPIVYLLGRRLGGRNAGLWSAGWLALSPFHIYYSQEVRMYAVVTLLVSVSVLLTLRAAEAPYRVSRWILLAIALLASVYTQYFAGFVLLAMTLYVLWRYRHQRVIVVRWMATLAGVLVAYLPWALYVAPRLWVYIRYKVGMDRDLPLSLVEFLRRALTAYGAGHFEGWLSDWWPAGLVIPGLVVVGLTIHTIIRRTAANRPLPHVQWSSLALPLCWLSILWTGAYIINLIAPFNPPRSERLLLIGVPAFALLIGGIVSEWVAANRHWAIGVNVIVILISSATLVAFYTSPRYPRDDYRPIVEQVHRQGLPSDAVLCVWPWQVGYFKAYWPASDPQPAIVETPSQIYPFAIQYWAQDPSRMRDEIDRLMAAHGRIWTPAYLAAGSWLEQVILEVLDSRHVRVLTQWHGDTNLVLHVSLPELTPTDVKGEFDARIAVSNVALAAAPVESAYGSVVVSAQWRIMRPVVIPYRITFRLADKSGSTWGQWSREPLLGKRPFDQWGSGEEHTERYGLTIEPGTPPGLYTLKLSVRDLNDAPLPITSGAALDAWELDVGAITIVRPPAPIDIDILDTLLVSVDLDRRVRLIGYRRPTGTFTPGTSLTVDLYWKCLQPAAEVFTFVQLLDGKGQLAAATEGPPTGGLFPSTMWQPGDVIRDIQTLRLPASLSDGRYPLIAGLFYTEDKRRLVITNRIGRARDFISLGTVEIRGRGHQFQAPKPTFPLAISFGTTARLIGYDLALAPNPPHYPAGRIVLYWQALEETSIAYKVFVHAFSETGEKLGQHDSEPAFGAVPTTSWVAGEYIEDVHPLPATADESVRPHTLWIGLYDPTTLQRLPVWREDGTPAGDHLVLELP